ncbi:MAG: hypothetical protein AAF682_15290 [Planctomycetota bacterium]
MVPGKKFLLCLGSLVLSLLAACSGSSSGGSGNSLLSVTQDLTLDPNGFVTVVAFQKNLPPTLGPGNFSADGGQIALTVVVVDAEARVTWDERVTPSHQVMALGIKGVSEVFGPVGSTDADPPTFAVTSAIQTPGLGGDTISAQFSGANVLESLVEDLASWELVVNEATLDLTGSTFDFNPTTQVLSVTLGAGANLHAAFELIPVGVTSVADVALGTTPVAGAATGDTTPPTFTSAVQQLSESEFGYVVDFTFSDAMDPVFATQLSNFDAGFPVFASAVEQISDTVLRVTFTDPMVPGVDEVDLVGELMDAHGNALTPVGAPVPVSQGTTVANAYAVTPELDTVESLGGDTLSLGFTQALDPDTAEESSRWNVESPTGVALDLSGATFSYDLASKSLTITLAEDVLTGDTFEVGPAGGSAPMDVDGEDFTAVFAGTVTGDIAAPAVVSVTQDRVFDPDGLTLYVQLSEDVDSVDAETAGNWTLTGGASVDSASLLPSLDTVRLVLDDLAVPGEDTLSVAALEDFAGNALAAALTGITISSTDTVQPTPGGLTAVAVEGADNDEVQITFDDEMLESEVEDVLNWTVEMPFGNSLDTTNASIDYDPDTRIAILVFDGGDEIDLKVRDDFSLSLSGMRDIAGNEVSIAPVSTKVLGENNFPSLESVWVDPINPTRLHVQFSEPCDELADIAGLTAYTVRDDAGLAVGNPASVSVDADRQGATLLMGFGVVPGTHTLDVSGVTDLAGNALFPVFDAAIAAEDDVEPALDPGFSVVATVSGEENDTVTVEFDRTMSSWGIGEAENYGLDDGAPIDLEGAEFDFDGDSTVVITLAGVVGDLITGDLYTVSVDGLRSDQGVEMTAASAEAVLASGDLTAADQTALRTRIDASSPSDSVLIEFDEALDQTEAETVGNILKGGVAPDSATRLGYRTVRAVWSGGVTAGESIDVTMTDLAGNVGVTSQLAQAASATGPALLTVDGVIEPGFGGDRVLFGFNTPVDAGSAGVISNYAIDQGGVAVDLSGAALRYSSSTNTVTVLLPSGVELDPSQNVHAVVDNVANFDGVAISPAGDLIGTVTGDLDAPDFSGGFVNYRADATGIEVDLYFTEDVDPTFAETASNFVPSGGQTALTAELLRADVVRLTLSAPLVAGDTIDTTGIEDAAGLAAGAISVEPIL